MTKYGHVSNKAKKRKKKAKANSKKNIWITLAVIGGFVALIAIAIALSGGAIAGTAVDTCCQ